jgi:dTDP-4-dehydrorhamnose reductase
MKLKVLVLGSTGLIGHQVFHSLASTEKYEMFNLSYRKKLNNETILCNVRSEKKFIDIIKLISPDVIINCIGILIQGSDLDPENAIFINAYFPHRLMSLADELNSKLIHISTDCVFSGAKEMPYIEKDFKDGKDTYAKSKGLGEIINKNHLTLRTSVVGPELKRDGEELFHWFMSQTGEVNGFTKAVWSGVTTLILAKVVGWAIDNKITGLYHVTNNNSIDKYSLLCLIKHYTKKNISIIPVEDKKPNKSFIDTRNELDFIIPSYEVMIRKMIDMMHQNKEIYEQYNLNSS